MVRSLSTTIRNFKVSVTKCCICIQSYAFFSKRFKLLRIKVSCPVYSRKLLNLLLNVCFNFEVKVDYFSGLLYKPLEKYEKDLSAAREVQIKVTLFYLYFVQENENLIFSFLAIRKKSLERTRCNLRYDESNSSCKE